MLFKNWTQRLKPDKALLQTLVLLVGVFLICSLSLVLGYFLKNLDPEEYGILRGRKEDLEITYKELLFFSSVVLALFLLSVSFRYVKRQKPKLILVSFASLYLFAAAIIVLVDVIYYLIFACRITFSAIQTILNSNPEEAKGFIKLYYSPGRILSILLFIAALLLVIFKRARLIALFSTRSFFITTLFFSIIGIIDFGQIAHAKGNGPHNVRYWDIIIGEYNEYREFNRRLEAEKNNHHFSKEYDSFYKQDTLTKTLVFVISESLSKRHMSLYGYPRITTPHLDTNKNIYKFNDCVTQAALTIEAVPGLFFNGYLSKRINLITLLNKLDYETSWISNQSAWGKGDRPIVLLSQLSRKSVFTDGMADDYKANASSHYDESVLAQFSQILNSPSRSSKFVVLHLMGCHFEYEKRYPLNRNFFRSEPPVKTVVHSERSKGILNSYDNAMLYHDSIINEVIKIFSEYSLNKNSALVFLSDHGEDLYENRNHAGHGFPPSKATSDIPYFVLLSPTFKKNYPVLETIMRARSNTPYSTADNFYTLIHLLNISSKKHKGKILRHGFFSSLYDSSQTRFVMGIDYRNIDS